MSWTGAAGDNNWDTASNWSTDSVPGAGDDVTIDIAANVVHSNAVTDSINSLTSTEPLTISGGTLSIAAASTIDNTLSITGGMLTGTGDVTVSGLVTLTAGTLSGASALDANGGMVINPTGGNFNLDGRTINNAAGQTATWTGTVDNFIEASDGSVFNNLGTFVVDGLALYEQSNTGASSAFNNMGSFTTTATTANVGFDVPFNIPGGSIDIQNGSQLDLDEGGTITDAALDIEANGNLDLGNYTFDTATTMTGAGGLELGGVVLPANYTFTGSTFVEGPLQVDGSLAGSALSFSDSGNAVLSGTGTVGAMSVGAGTVSPGDGSNPGILNAQGDVVLEPPDLDEEFVGSTFAVVLNGATAGAGYSQLNVNGSVDLGGGALDASLGFTPANGEQFTIIKSTAPIVGTFAGLAEGASLTIGDTPFTISYDAGNGDDVVLTAGTAAAVPTVTITPTSGPTAGGTAVAITGTNLSGATAVDFGTTPATSFFFVSADYISATSPPGTGTVNVTVTTPSGTSAASTANEFTYTATAAPAVTGVSPNSGPAAGGTLVTITGTGFTGATAVDFGTIAATDVTVQSATTITALSPAGTGLDNVTVTTPNGSSATSTADQFTYIATAPAVVSVQRFGFHMQPTAVVLSFSSALDAARAEDVNNYRIVAMGGNGRTAASVGQVTPVRAAVYDPTTFTVTLYTRGRLSIHKLYRLTVNGSTPLGLMGATGVPLNRQGNETHGTSYVRVLSGKLLAGRYHAAP